GERHPALRRFHVNVAAGLADEEFERDARERAVVALYAPGEAAAVGVPRRAQGGDAVAVDPVTEEGVEVSAALLFEHGLEGDGRERAVGVGGGETAEGAEEGVVAETEAEQVEDAAALLVDGGREEGFGGAVRLGHERAPGVARRELRHPHAVPRRRLRPAAAPVAAGGELCRQPHGQPAVPPLRWAPA